MVLRCILGVLYIYKFCSLVGPVRVNTCSAEWPPLCTEVMLVKCRKSVMEINVYVCIKGT